MSKAVEFFNKVKQSLFGLRKFIAFLLTLIIAVTFRLTEYINGREMVDLLQVVGSAFFASNTINKLSEAIKEKLKDR